MTRQLVFNEFSKNIWIKTRARKFILSGMDYNSAMVKAQEEFDKKLETTEFAYEDRSHQTS